MAREFARKKKGDWTLVVEENTKLKGLKNIVISMLFPSPPGQCPLFLCNVENSQILCVFYCTCCSFALVRTRGRERAAVVAAASWSHGVVSQTLVFFLSFVSCCVLLVNKFFCDPRMCL
jgi:hypothetical protein